MFEKPDTTIVYIHTSSIITFLILFRLHAVKQKNASDELANTVFTSVKSVLSVEKAGRDSHTERRTLCLIAYQLRIWSDLFCFTECCCFSSAFPKLSVKRRNTCFKCNVIYKDCTLPKPSEWPRERPCFCWRWRQAVGPWRWSTWRTPSTPRASPGPSSRPSASPSSTGGSPNRASGECQSLLSSNGGGGGGGERGGVTKHSF